VEIAAALFAGALTLFALADMPARAPAPVAIAIPTAVAAETTPAPLRSASYYPEHLAALQSLSGFHPMAEGEKLPASPIALVALTKPAPFDPKTPRRAEAKTIVAKPPAAAPGQAAQKPQPTPAEGPIKVFGLSLPTDVGAQVTNLRDVAGRWGAAASGLGEKAATLWR
jgi:hypothetical protein